MPIHTVPRRLVIGRYVLEREIGSGGMAAVYLGRLQGAAGFSRAVAIKRLHPQFARDSAFAAALVDEAQLAGSISHPNVVQILDVVRHAGELLLVMELIQGETLSALVARHARPVAPEIAVKLGSDVLAGLHAAHEARDEHGRSLELVHRDVSPQNVMVGLDGSARLIDFGVAKALGRLQQTRDGVLKGKLGYLAPEAVRSGQLDRRADVYATGVVLWELLTGRRLFAGESDIGILAAVVEGRIESPSELCKDVPPALDRVVLRALAGDPDARFSSAQQMAEALEAAAQPARARQVSEWVRAESNDAITRTLEDQPDFASVSATLRLAPGELEIPSAALPSTLKIVEPASGPVEPHAIVQATLVSAGSEPGPDLGKTLPDSPRAIEADPMRTAPAVPRPSRGNSQAPSGALIEAPRLARDPLPQPPRRSFVLVVALLVVLALVVAVLLRVSAR